VTDAVTVSLIAAVSGVVIAMLQRLTKRVDGRLTELLELTRKSSHAEGVRDGKQSDI
jgi:hypothetical protein